MFRPMRVTLHLDGTGIYYDPREPIMLDALLAAAVCRYHVHGEPPARDEVPVDIPLPLRRCEREGTWGWHASALFPDGMTLESLQHWRKRLRQERIERTVGAPCLTNGVYRNWNMPVPLLLATRMVGYAYGEAGRVRRELRRSVRYMGRKRAHGRGAVVGVEVEAVAEDWSLCMGGVAVRWLPSPRGTRLVRPRPPYWNTVQRVPCLEIGEPL